MGDQAPSPRIMLGQCPADLHPSALGPQDWVGYLHVHDVDGLYAEFMVRGTLCSAPEDTRVECEIIVTNNRAALACVRSSVETDLITKLLFGIEWSRPRFALLVPLGDRQAGQQRGGYRRAHQGRRAGAEGQLQNTAILTGKELVAAHRLLDGGATRVVATRLNRQASCYFDARSLETAYSRDWQQRLRQEPPCRTTWRVDPCTNFRPRFDPLERQ